MAPEGLVDLPATHKGDTPCTDVMYQLCHDVVDKPPLAQSATNGRYATGIRPGSWVD